MSANYAMAMTLITEARILLNLLNSPDSPVTRWNSLQDWLAHHPKWKKKVKRYTTIEPSAALADLKQYICEQAEIPEIILASFITPEIEATATKAIEQLQTLYRDRKAQDTRKEIVE
jgi:hypothetical protein